MVSRVVGQSAESRVRELFLLNEVALPQFIWINFHFASQCIHATFNGICCLWSACATVCIGWCERCEHTRATEVICLRQVIHTCIQERSKQWHSGGNQLQVRAHVRNNAESNSGQLAITVCGKFNMLYLSASVDRCVGVLAALFNPTNWHIVLAGECQTQEFFCIHVEL